ncbi:MAG: hypothetical protein RIC55_31675 [Pirellulaceae bacterium]
MPIKVTCQCGQSFAAKDEMAGKTVRCPKCKQPLKIPGGASRPTSPSAPQSAQPRGVPAAPANDLGDLFDEIGLAPPEPTATGHPCPSCGQPMRPGAVLCVNCGFNLQTGQRVASDAPQTAAKPKDAEEGHGAAAAEEMIAKASKELSETPISAEGTDFGEGTNPIAWVVALCLPLLLGVAVFAIAMWGTYFQYYMEFIGTGIEKGDYLLITLALLSICLTATLMTAWFRIVFIALEENILWGLLCILVCGIAVPVYGIIRWQKCLSWVITFLVCAVLSVPLLIVQFAMFAFYRSQAGG